MNYKDCHYYEPDIEDFIDCPVTMGEVLQPKCSECHHSEVQREFDRSVDEERDRKAALAPDV